MYIICYIFLITKYCLPVLCFVLRLLWKYKLYWVFKDDCSLIFGMYPILSTQWRKAVLGLFFQLVLSFCHSSVPWTFLYQLGLIPRSLFFLFPLPIVKACRALPASFLFFDLCPPPWSFTYLTVSLFAYSFAHLLSSLCLLLVNPISVSVAKYFLFLLK